MSRGHRPGRSRRPPRPRRRRARGRSGSRRGAALRRGSRRGAGPTDDLPAGPERCSARRPSTCSAPNRASCPPSCTTSWSAPPTTRPGRGWPPRSPAAGRTPGQPARAVPFADEAVHPGRAGGRTGAARRLPRRGAGRALGARRARRSGAPSPRDSTTSPRTSWSRTSRLQAHLWGLQVACEGLDVQAIHRHMRALELLGEESPRALFFAASRRLMLDLLRGRTDTAAELIRGRHRGGRAGGAGGRVDGAVKAMQGYAAAQSGDPPPARRWRPG